MAVGNIIYSTSSTTIVSGDVINASDFERGTNLQVDTVSGNLNIAGGINTGGVSNLGSIDNLIITGGNSGDAIITDGSGGLTWDVRTINAMSVQTLTTGSSFTFSEIPAGTKKIILLGADVTATGYSLSDSYLQLGTTSGIETSGYSTAVSYIGDSASQGTSASASTSSISLSRNNQVTFAIEMNLLSTNFWIIKAQISNYNTNLAAVGNTYMVVATKLLSGALSQLKVTTTHGNFTAGKVNILYET
jgi:hypothetical protein